MNEPNFQKIAAIRIAPVNVNAREPTAGPTLFGKIICKFNIHSHIYAPKLHL